MQLLCCPFKCLVKMCRCCCKDLPECCHSCADEKNPQDRKIIMNYEERLRRLENEARKPDQKVVPTNHGMQMEQSRGMQQMQQSSPTRGMQQMQTSGRNFTKENRTQSAGEHLCSCGCGLEGATHHDKVLETLLGSDEGHPVYFNVPGLQCEQTQYIKMSPHVPFSLAGVLRKKREGTYMFTIPKALRRQLRTCHRIGIPCVELPQPFPLNANYFSAVLPGHVAMYFISVEANYTCVNPCGCQ